MRAVARIGGKIAIIVVAVTAVDLAGHILDGTPLPDLPRSALAATLGVEATVSGYFLLMFGLLSCLFFWVERSLSGGKVTKGLRFGTAIGALLFFAVVEIHPIFGTPIWGDIRTGAADFVPVVLLGLLLGLWVGTSSRRATPGDGGTPMGSLALIALVFVVGRYFAYAVIGIESGLLSRPLATLLWTAAAGVCVASMYWLLGEGATARSPVARALWFTGVIFGTSWILFHLFMPLLFRGNVAAIMLRPLLDMVFVFAGSLLAETAKTRRSLKIQVTS